MILQPPKGMSVIHFVDDIRVTTVAQDIREIEIVIVI